MAAHAEHPVPTYPGGLRACATDASARCQLFGRHSPWGLRERSQQVATLPAELFRSEIARRHTGGGPSAHLPYCTRRDPFQRHAPRAARVLRAPSRVQMGTVPVTSQMEVPMGIAPITAHGTSSRCGESSRPSAACVAAPVRSSNAISSRASPNDAAPATPPSIATRPPNVHRPLGSVPTSVLQPLLKGGITTASTSESTGNGH